MQQGDRLGNYQIIRRLGAGAMGEVWLGEHEMLSALRAIKVLPPELAQSVGFREGFVREGRVLAGLRHPNIVQVYDMGVEGDVYFIAMDFVSPDGKRSQSLDELLKAGGGRTAPDEVARSLTQICEAVAYAHDQGVIHRDIKPSNVLVAERGQVRLSDFGLAKVIGAEFIQKSIAASISCSVGAERSLVASSTSHVDKSLGAEASAGSNAGSNTQSLVGTFHYMPPEVQERGEWTKQGDIYSIGVLAYVMLTGRRPVGRWKNPSVAVADVPPFWDGIVERALEEDPSARFASAEEMLQAIRSSRVQSQAGATGAGVTSVSQAPQLAHPSVRTESVQVVDPRRPVSEIDRILAEAKALEAPLRAAEAAFAKVMEIDRMGSVSDEDKRRAWQLYLEQHGSTGCKVAEAERRLGELSLVNAGPSYVESLGGGVNLEMVWIKSGSFLMGSDDGEDNEKPVHSVALDGFWLGKYEVTQAQYEMVMGANPSNFRSVDNPVEQVSWDDAVAFCNKLSKATGKKYALPTEAQWEYACRAGSTGAYCFGDSGSQLGSYAWYYANSSGITHPVGQKKSNAWGLYDMNGNVWEWCQDSYHPNYTDAPTDSSAWVSPSASRQVVRGGYWFYGARFCRSANRNYYSPSYRSGNVGFRLASVR